jgi:hypothetical protein
MPYLGAFGLKTPLNPTAPGKASLRSHIQKAAPPLWVAVTEAWRVRGAEKELRLSTVVILPGPSTLFMHIPELEKVGFGSTR